MEKALKEKWVTALRSGKYQQTEGELRDSEGGFCCLGVLCDIVNPEGWKEDFHPMQEDNGDEHLNEAILTHEQQKPLYSMNDGARGYEKKTFPEIADYIEANL